jgi:Protein of unknown function (DUF2827)
MNILDLNKKLVVGITFFVSPSNTSIWATGAIQNVIYLYLLMQRIPSVAEVILVNGGDSDVLSDALMLHGMDIKIARFPEIVDRLDVLIEAGAVIDRESIAELHRRGGKAVAYRMGNDFVIDMERVIFKQQPGYLFNQVGFDEIWTLPHHEKTCRSYWEVMERCPVKVLPYIWTPLFLDKAIAELSSELHFGYKPSPEKKNIAIFEPNVNVVKTCHYPLLVCEAAYRQDPSLFKSIYVTNTTKIRDHLTFQHFIGTMDIGKNKIATVEDRFLTPFFMSAHAQVVVSHQWENQLNNLYLDVLYGGYPLIHNSEMLKCGYYYEPFNAEAGAQVLLEVLRNHDSRADAYNAEAKAFLATMHIDYPDNIHRHEQALWSLFADES